MRMLVVLAGFAAVIGVATPAGPIQAAMARFPDTSFLAALDTAGSPTRAKLPPLRSAKRRAH